MGGGVSSRQLELDVGPMSRCFLPGKQWSNNMDILAEPVLNGKAKDNHRRNTDIGAMLGVEHRYGNTKCFLEATRKPSVS